MPTFNDEDIKQRQNEIRKTTHEHVENNLMKYIIVTENDDLASTKIIHGWFNSILKKDIKVIKWPAREENINDFYHRI